MIFFKLYKTENDVLDLIDKTLENKSGSRLTYFNQHCFNIYISNKEYRNLLDNSFEVFFDGVGIYLALKMFGYKNVQRFNATDLNEKIFNSFAEQHTSLFLIGGKFNNEFVFGKLFEKKINVVGYQNGYFEEQHFKLIVDHIKRASPEVIVIAMGVPKQEILAHRLTLLIKVDLILCVGGFLEFYFGTKSRVPEVFRNSGLEWLYRLMKEPARLWKRYLVGIGVFSYNILKEYLRLKSEKRN